MDTSGGYLSCSGKKDTKEAGQRGSLDLPIETPFPFGIPQALLLWRSTAFRCVIYGTEMLWVVAVKRCGRDS